MRVLISQLELWLSEAELLRDFEDEAVKERRVDRVDPRVDAAVGVPPPEFSHFCYCQENSTAPPVLLLLPFLPGSGGRGVTRQQGVVSAFRNRRKRLSKRGGGGVGGGGTKRDR